MPFDFGNIYAMSQNDFQTATEYYRGRIELITNDDSISAAVKRWFVKEYTKKIKRLEKANQKLQETINQVESRIDPATGTPVYVNRETATINSLNGTTKTGNKPFKNLGVGNVRHNIAQILRIVGAVCLPLIGSIPFGIAFHRSRKRHKLRAQENIALNRFVNDSSRTFDAALISTTPFTEKEMQELLENPREIQRLVNLTLSTSNDLNPKQKAILTEKLTALKAYAQKNGYPTTAITPLASTTFNTSTDKINDSFTAISTTPTDLRAAYDDIKRLENLKTQAEALLEADKDNTVIKNLITSIDGKITTLKTAAQTFVDNGLSALSADLSSATVPESDRDETHLRNSNRNLDNFYNDNTRFRTGGSAVLSVEEAKTLATELGLNVSAFDTTAKIRTNAKAANQAKLTIVENYDRLLEESDHILNTVLSDSSIDALESGDLATAKANLDKAKANLDNLRDNSRYITDTSKTARYTALMARYSTVNARFETHSNDLTADENDFNSYRSTISSITTTGDIHTLKSNISTIEFVLSKITTPEYASIFNSIGRSSDLSNLIKDANLLKSQIEQEIANLNIAAKNIDEYESEINSIIVTSDYETNKLKLRSILDIIDKPTFKEGLDEPNRRKLALMIATANGKIAKIDEMIQAEREAEEATKNMKADKASARNAAVEKIEQEIANCNTRYHELINKFNTITDAARRKNIREELIALHARVQRIDSMINATSGLTAQDKKLLTKKAGLLGHEMNVLTSGLTL